jgi:hypothetical protein
MESMLSTPTAAAHWRCYLGENLSSRVYLRDKSSFPYGKLPQDMRLTDDPGLSILQTIR